MRNKETLIFLHIPRTGGTTLRTIIDSQYLPGCILTGSGFELKGQLQRLREGRRQNIKVLQGHMPFGLHEYLDGHVHYITLLRDPIDRVISSYYFILARPMHRLHNDVVGRKMSLSEYADNESFPQVTNQQTRLISGLGRELTAQSLETAKSNLSVHFSAVGLTERFEESVVLFERRLGWASLHYKKRNVTQDRPTKSDLPNSTIRLIEKNNMLDMELYEFAAQRFDEAINDEAIDEQDLSSWDDICNFPQLNRG